MPAPLTSPAPPTLLPPPPRRLIPGRYPRYMTEARWSTFPFLLMAAAATVLLLVPAPRPFAFRHPFVLLWILAAWAFITLFVWWLWIKALRTRRIYRDGLATTGTITAMRKVRHREWTIGYVEFVYADSFGREHRAQMPVHDEWQWLETKLGRPVTVLYLPTNPALAIAYELGCYTVSPSPNDNDSVTPPANG